MEDKKETVENVKVEGTGEVVTQTTEKVEGTVDVNVEAQKIADAIVAKKLAKMPTKEQLAEFKKWEDSQKTETEKQAEKDRKLLEKDSENINLKNENLLLRKGINSDDIDYILFKVSKIEGEFDTNLDNFLKENPKYLGQAKEIITTGIPTMKNNNQKESGVTAILRQKRPDLFKE